jgi:hypothetical protein
MYAIYACSSLNHKWVRTTHTSSSKSEMIEICKMLNNISGLLYEVRKISK